jgi:hypothetical protein
MKTTITNAGLKVRTTLKAAGLPGNHSRNGLKVRTSLRAAGLPGNHSRNGLKVKTGVKAGEVVFCRNHSRLMQALA